VESDGYDQTLKKEKNKAKMEGFLPPDSLFFLPLCLLEWFEDNESFSTG
jgi:hypothetical protein